MWEVIYICCALIDMFGRSILQAFKKPSDLKLLYEEGEVESLIGESRHLNELLLIVCDQT